MLRTHHPWRSRRVRQAHLSRRDADRLREARAADRDDREPACRQRRGVLESRGGRMKNRQSHDDLPPGFTYLDPPADWPRSEWDDPRRLRLMALSFRLLLVG